MKLEQLIEDDAIVLKISGELDSTTAPDVRTTFDEVQVIVGTRWWERAFTWRLVLM